MNSIVDSLIKLGENKEIYVETTYDNHGNKYVGIRIQDSNSKDNYVNPHVSYYESVGSLTTIIKYHKDNLDQQEEKECHLQLLNFEH